MSVDVVPARRMDLRDRAQVHDAVVAFYREIVFDDLLEPLFGEVAEVDWAEHIPKLIDYWCRVLFGDVDYAGFVLDAHRRVHALEPFTAEHFERWLALWERTIDASWSGPFADQAKRHARRIAAVLARQLPG